MQVALIDKVSKYIFQEQIIFNSSEIESMKLTGLNFYHNLHKD
jgi:hypothetical protein